ncbi:MAG: sugar-binding protein [Armatimonadota bacterium]
MKQARMYFGMMAIILAVAVSVSAAGEPAVTAVRVEDREVQLDGKLDEPFWQSATPHSGFTLWKEEGDKVHDTEFRLVYDDTYLYIGLRCDNPLQDLVFKPKVTEHDGPVTADESVEIFLDPGTNGRLYYHFMLSSFNIKAEQVMKVGQTLVRDRGWDHPWRSAVQAEDDGWTAEVGIPLYLVASYGDLEKMRLNITRNRRAPFMDPHGVITHEERHSSSWQPVKDSFHEPDAFAPIAAVRPETLQIPFMAGLELARVSTPYLDRGDRFFDVDVDVRGATGRAGELELIVKDQPSIGKGATLREQIALEGRQVQKLSVAVPMESISDRRIQVSLRDAETGEVWGRRIIENPDALDVLNVYLDRNYYTTEEEAVLVAEIGLPADSLEELAIRVLGPDDAVLAQGDDVAPETHIAFPLEEMEAGAHAVKMELRPEGKGDDSPAMLSDELELIKRSPKPGLEWKIDQINRVLLNPDGEPVFPFGPAMGRVYPYPEYEDVYRELAEAGFNTFYQWQRYVPPAETVRFSEMARKHGLYSVVRLATGWSQYNDSGLKLPEKYLNEQEADKLLSMPQTGSIHIRGFLMNVQSADYAQRTEIFNEYYHKNVDNVKALINSVMNEKNLISYNTFDEATAMRWFDISQAMHHLRDLTQEMDGYHPVSFISGKGVPEDRVYEGATDIFSPDPYWVPTSPREGANTTPNFVTKKMSLSHQRNRVSRKVLWAVPVGWVWSAIRRTSKRPIAAEEQHCQSFLAIIHGARGLFWFVWPMHEIGWKNLTETAEMIQVIGPMAVQPKVEQDVEYAKITDEGGREPAPFDPAADRFPDVQGRVFRDPEGGLVLVAANSSYYPVRAEFTVSGLKRDVSRVFADDVLETEDGVFGEELEPLAVRAYRLGDLAEPLSLNFAAQRTGPRSPLGERALVNKWRPDKKNVLPNPSFEEETIEGLPDYYITTENGVALERDPALVKFGEKCVRLETDRMRWTNPQGRTRYRYFSRGTFHSRPIPRVEKETPFVWSVWLRGEEGGEEVELQFGAESKVVTVEKEWKRFSMPVVISPGLTGRTSPGMNVTVEVDAQNPAATCWVDGIQLEKGEEMTAFTEN